jgi:3-hydroxybutyrate dehydrogenase
MVSIMTPAGLADRTAIPRELEGRIAIVTGSTSGIGLGIAEALAAQGAGVVLNGFGADAAIAETCRRLAETHAVPVRHDAADLAEAAQIVALVARTERAFGPVDILVNNAGLRPAVPAGDAAPEAWDLVLALDLSAVFHATRAVLPGMLARGHGRIVNIAPSQGPLAAGGGKLAYAAARHGVIGFTRATALAAARHGVTCNVVCPGQVWTPLVAAQVAALAAAQGLTEQAVIKDNFLAEQPSGRFVSIEEVAEITAFLCRGCAGAINGIALPVDGGWTAR